MTLGRSNEADIIVEDDSVSREHLKISQTKDHILIKDNNTTNGTFVKSKKINEAKIKIGESFIIGDLEFFLREGTVEEFQLSGAYHPIPDEPTKENQRKKRTAETDIVSNIYDTLLKHILLSGLKKQRFEELIAFLSKTLTDLAEFGNLYLISIREGEPFTYLSISKQKKSLDLSTIITRPDFFKEKILQKNFPQTKTPYYSYPTTVEGKDAALVYICNSPPGQDEPLLRKFLSGLSKEIELLSQVFSEKKKKTHTETKVVNTEDEIIAASKEMKDLINIAKKIAGSNIFILIQGESGTGKELFARLIHNYSKRNKNKFVAINCAAIPENLLESELFGHEKGAFTGAYEKKIGKLELASGGTLVFDEIGDMPLSLQSKLLRALQENEFYRLGGTAPINVDLRIISITNKDLKRLINDKKFREDLYFRLVHRTITIPPLRDRKEDITILINYFTDRFCMQQNKTIAGYSVKAFELLQKFNWRGNVRQLENEIKSLINLTANGEIINYDILSDELRSLGVPSNETADPKGQNFYIKPDRETILKLLEKNQWNKAKTARDLNITYQGLHKKLKRLGIKKKK
jgi:transcriptional regulator with PAS, ATPase and Fis domain